MSGQWRGQVDKGNRVGALFLDFSVAFDLADHDIFVEKLLH